MPVTENRTWWVPILITMILLADFTGALAAVMYKVLRNPANVIDPKIASILDMLIVFLIGSTGGGLGYWLGRTHGETEKDKEKIQMIYNSTPTPVASDPDQTDTKTSTKVTSTTETVSEPATEGKT